jgi:DNA mismatch endonuclease (patch repair protein)
VGVAAHGLGRRCRVWGRPGPLIRRTADLVFTRARGAVFSDGCFWHGCPQHRTRPRTNATYWAEKIEGNIARDLDTTARLEAAGWRVLRYWQHEDPLAVARAIATVVRRPAPEQPPVTPQWPHAPVRGGGAAS